ncbi:MAG: hypothetical protein LBL30_02180 [Holosporales bacterium]|jgi:hypothetical protein|nr:hypothetical protein [Holosporales bacterium]
MDSPWNPGEYGAELYAKLVQEPTLLIQAFYLLNPEHRKNFVDIFRSLVEGKCPIMLSGVTPIGDAICEIIKSKRSDFLHYAYERLLESIFEYRGDDPQSIKYAAYIAPRCGHLPVIRMIQSAETREALKSKGGNGGISLFEINASLGSGGASLNHWRTFLKGIATGHPSLIDADVITFLQDRPLMKKNFTRVDLSLKDALEELFFDLYVDGVRSVNAYQLAGIGEDLNCLETVLAADANLQISWGFEFTPFRAGPEVEALKKTSDVLFADPIIIPN